MILGRHVEICNTNSSEQKSLEREKDLASVLSVTSLTEGSLKLSVCLGVVSGWNQAVPLR